jgi:hypothetical protein
MPGIEIKGTSKRANYRHGGSTGGYQPDGAKAAPKYFTSNSDYYPSGGVPLTRAHAKEGGGDDKWIQKATKNMRKDKPCTGKKFGSKTCPPGSKRYVLAKTFRSMNKKG